MNSGLTKNAKLRILALSEETGAETLHQLAISEGVEVRECVAINKNISRETLLLLLKDREKNVRYEANRNETHKNWIAQQKTLSLPLSLL